MAQNSAAATPTPCADWPDLKGAYRLFDNSKVSFQPLIAPHRQLARQQCRGTVNIPRPTQCSKWVIVAVVAIRLLQLRAAARQKPDEPAQRHIPQPYLVSLCAIMNKSSSSPQAKRAAATPETLTDREFYRRVAQLGGFIGRKSDGEPGWQTLWRGVEKRHSIVYGYSLAQTCG